MEYDLLVAGHICLDIIPDITTGQEIRPGVLINVGSSTISTGGAVANTGLAAHILGCRVAFCARLGEDYWGQIILQILQQYDHNLIQHIRSLPEEHTSYTIVINIPGKDRTFLHDPAANHRFSSVDVPETLLQKSRIFHFGYPTLMRTMYLNEGEELWKLYTKAKRHPLMTSLDTAFPDPQSEAGQVNWKKVLARVAPLVDIYMPNYDELRQMILPEAPSNPTLPVLKKMATMLIDWGFGVVAIKLGHLGLYLQTARDERIQRIPLFDSPSSVQQWSLRQLYFPVFKVDKVVGTTGAGDSATAGFLLMCLRRTSPEEAGNFACAVGALNVQAFDALSGLKSAEETLQFMKQTPKKIFQDFSISGWQWDDAKQIFYGPDDSKQ